MALTSVVDLFRTSCPPRRDPVERPADDPTD
jgi:hypothetical protein